MLIGANAPHARLEDPLLQELDIRRRALALQFWMRIVYAAFGFGAIVLGFAILVLGLTGSISFEVGVTDSLTAKLVNAGPGVVFACFGLIITVIAAISFRVESSVSRTTSAAAELAEGQPRDKIPQGWFQPAGPVERPGSSTFKSSILAFHGRPDLLREVDTDVNIGAPPLQTAYMLSLYFDRVGASELAAELRRVALEKAKEEEKRFRFGTGVFADASVKGDDQPI